MSATASVAVMPSAVLPAGRHAKSKPLCAHILPTRLHCPNTVRWKIDHGYYCHKHAEEFWDTHYVENHAVIRLMKDDWESSHSHHTKAEQPPELPIAAIHAIV